MSNVKTYFRSEKTTDVWLTPPNIASSLGKFDLDPCSPINPPWRLAPIYYTEKHDGLKQPWFGRVFLNPPYGEQTKHWMEKLANHGNGIALVFARIETKWFNDFVWKSADAVLFFDTRIAFYKENGERGQSASAPSCLVAYGHMNHFSLYNCSTGGTIVDIKKGCHIK